MVRYFSHLNWLAIKKIRLHLMVLSLQMISAFLLYISKIELARAFTSVTDGFKIILIHIFALTVFIF